MNPMVDKPIVAVVGDQNSEKTMAVEVLAQGLPCKGYRVAVVKQVPKLNFTIGREDADTQRYVKADASVVVNVSPNELIIVKRVDTKGIDPAGIMTKFGEDVDLMILDGFKEFVKKYPQIPKIIAVKNIDDIHKASKRFSAILAYVGSTDVEAPPTVGYINLLEEEEKLIGLVYKKVEEIKGRFKPFKETRITVDGRSLPCKRFVQEVIRKTVLAMISTLKGAEIKGDEEIQITIKTKAT